MHGKGTYKFQSGHVYAGSWFENRMHGSGNMEYGDGTKYNGAWSMNEMHGEGTYTDENKHVW